MLISYLRENGFCQEVPLFFSCNNKLETVEFD